MVANLKTKTRVTQHSSAEAIGNPTFFLAMMQILDLQIAAHVLVNGTNEALQADITSE